MFNNATPEFDCAYRHHIYPQGYTLSGPDHRPSLDNDSRMFSVAGLLTRANGDVLSIEVRMRSKSRRQRHARH